MVPVLGHSRITIKLYTEKLVNSVQKNCGLNEGKKKSRPRIIMDAT